MIRSLLQLLLLPLFIPLRFLYANVLRLQFATVLYSWCPNKKEFDAITIDDNTSGTKKSWEEWQDSAIAMEASCKKNKQVFIKVIIRSAPLRQWLKSNQLDNNSDNRERYIQHVYNTACKQGIELPSQLKEL